MRDKAALRRLQRPTIVGSQKTDGLARSQLETRGIVSIMFFVVRNGFVAQIGLRSYFPLNRTDLAYGLCLGDAKRCEVV
mgnify:CR=1 FL=1